MYHVFIAWKLKAQKVFKTVSKQELEVTQEIMSQSYVSTTRISASQNVNVYIWKKLGTVAESGDFS